jgi:hypothetical protein
MGLLQGCLRSFNNIVAGLRREVDAGRLGGDIIVVDCDRTRPAGCVQDHVVDRCCRRKSGRDVERPNTPAATLNLARRANAHKQKIFCQSRVVELCNRRS